MKSTWVKPDRITVILGGSLLLALALAIGVYIAYSSPTPVGSQTQEQEYLAYESARLFSFPGDWAQVSSTTARLIYPARASWEFVTSSEHPGSSSVLAGTNCASCHGNPVVGKSTTAGWAGPPASMSEGYGCQSCHGILEQRVEQLGEALVGGPGSMELNPVEGKLPYLDVEIKAAYDDEYLYMRFQWASERPGISHQLLQFDGEKWVKRGDTKPNATMPSYEDRLTVTVTDRNLLAYDDAQVGFAQTGCFITCHGTDDLIMYSLLSQTRVDGDGGLELKSEEELQSLLLGGDFLDMLTWRAAQSGPLGYAEDFYLLDDILRDEGDGPYLEQPIPPAYMYDESKVGFNAIPEALFEEMLNSFPLILGENAVPFDPDASFNEGDIIPRQVLVMPSGSAGDILVNSWWENGQWVIELRRKLDTGNPDDNVFEIGRVYYITLAVHDDIVSGRRHHVSFPLTLGIGIDADIKAVEMGD